MTTAILMVLSICSRQTCDRVMFFMTCSWTSRWLIHELLTRSWTSRWPKWTVHEWNAQSLRKIWMSRSFEWVIHDSITSLDQRSGLLQLRVPLIHMWETHDTHTTILPVGAEALMPCEARHEKREPLYSCMGWKCRWSVTQSIYLFLSRRYAL